MNQKKQQQFQMVTPRSWRITFIILPHYHNFQVANHMEWSGYLKLPESRVNYKNKNKYFKWLTSRCWRIDHLLLIILISSGRPHEVMWLPDTSRSGRPQVVINHLITFSSRIDQEILICTKFCLEGAWPNRKIPPLVTSAHGKMN